MRIASLLPPLLILIGCPEPIIDDPVKTVDSGETDTAGPPCDDADSDGDCDDVDCEPDDATIGPSVVEICDEIDNNCDGEIDEGVVVTYYIDADFDGFGDPSAPRTACTEPVGYTSNSGDCNDDEVDAYPGSPEVCDNIDNDCNNLIDDDAPFSTWYRDGDDDGFGDPDETEFTCFPSEGFVGDGTDCDDANGTTFPGSDESCNSVDDDCDGDVDEYGAIDGTIYYQDADDDGYGGRGIVLSSCDGAPDGYVLDATDCNDGDSALSPGAPEFCNNIDDDCDAEIDEGAAVGAPEWYLDADGDGYPGAISTIAACSMPADAFDYVSDCDDTTAAVSPSGSELCNQIDDNCDGDIDEGATPDGEIYYLDADLDGFAGAETTTTSCLGAPDGYLAEVEDCDDGSDEVSPAGIERCNSIDDNCDGEIDEDSAEDALVWYHDADGDGYAGTISTSLACSLPADAFAVADDCDDADAAHSPATPETCDGIDNSCEGLIDESFIAVPFAYATVQDGIDAAANGDIVCVAAGTFTETISFDGKAITVMGQGVGQTIIDGGGSGPVVAFDQDESGDSVLDSLTVQGGANVSDGAGVYVSGTSPTLQNLEIANHSCENRTRCRGVGIFLFESQATLKDVEVHSNYSAPSSASTTALLTASGAGIYAALSEGEWENVDVHDNRIAIGTNGVQPGEAQAAGAGIYITVGEIVATAIWSSGNSISQLAGAYYMDAMGAGLFTTGGANVFSDLVVDENSTDLDDGGATFGGGIGLKQDDSTFGQTRVTSNSSDGDTNFGSGIGIYYQSAPTFSNLVVADNRVTSEANSGYGAVWVYDSSTLSIFNADIYANRNEAGGEQFAGGIYSGSQADLYFTNVSIVENAAAQAGAVSTDGTGAVKIYYGNIYGNTSPEFSGMSSPEGGDGNIAVHPQYSLSEGPAVDWDFSLTEGSRCIDAGDPSIFDFDGSISDIGSQGGPGGDW